MHPTLAPSSSRLLRAAALGAFFVLAGANAHAADSRMVVQAKDYAAKHQFKVRTVVAPGPGKSVERHFVPVLPATYDDFRSRLVEANGGIAMRTIIDHVGHVAMQIEPNTTYLWGKNYTDYAGMYMSHASKGYLLGIDLADHEIQHLKVQMQKIPHDAGNCMMWLGSAEVAPGKLFFHELGVTRSRGAGDAIRQKLLRVSNERLKVAGVIVNSLEEFDAMTDAQLLGPAHPNGDAESVHE